MANIPDHPDIARCLRTGYPHEIKPHECQNCGSPAVAYGEASGYLCEDCLTDEFLSLTVAERAERLFMEALEDG